MRCIHCVRSPIRVWRSRARERHWRTCSGGIHASGSRPSPTSSRSQRASSRSVLARRLRPRNARVSTGSARCGTAPAATSASQTNSQPVHASTATCTSRPVKRPTQRSTAAGVASIRPRLTSPVSLSSASKVICARCTSNPATIAIGASFEFRQLPIARTISRRAERGPSSCHLYAKCLWSGACGEVLEVPSTNRLEVLGECGDLRTELGDCLLAICLLPWPLLEVTRAIRHGGLSVPEALDAALKLREDVMQVQVSVAALDERRDVLFTAYVEEGRIGKDPVALLFERPDRFPCCAKVGEGAIQFGLLRILRLVERGLDLLG